MGIAASMRVEAQLAPDIWTDLTPDTHAAHRLRGRYGIDGNGPLDCVASTGEVTLALKNHAGNSGGQQGYYSPRHASKRAGWTFGIPLQVVFSHGDDVAKSVSGITRSGTTATATVTGHGFATNQYVTITGAGQAEYNGTFKITVVDPDTFTYAVAASGVTPATGIITARAGYVKHRGKVSVIDPDAGQYGSQLCRVVSYDGIYDLADTELRSVALQTNKSEDQLVAAILDALPTDAQPVARNLDVGVDSYPYAFDELKGGAKALSVIQDVAVSAFALAFLQGDGTFRLQSRNTRATGVSVFSFNDSMHGLAVPTSLDGQVYNVVRVTIHGRTISAAPTEELYSLPTGSYIEIPQGQTREVWTDYSDPNDRQTPVGGSAVVEALVGGTHYAANSASDGSGSNMTADITAAIEPFASTAKWTLTNTAAITAYIITLKAIGKALRDPGPQTYQASSAQKYTKPLHVDLKYQANASTAQGYATYLEAQYRTLEEQIGSVHFIVNDSADFLRQFLIREPGDIITVTEAVTGVTAVDAVIQSIEFEVAEGPWIVCRFGLAPAAPFQSWILGITGRSELGETTVLGF